VSTTHPIIKKSINKKFNFILEVTEQSSEFEIECDREYKDTGYYAKDGSVSSPRLTGDELIEGAIKMIQVALYSTAQAKEKHLEIIEKIKGLPF